MIADHDAPGAVPIGRSSRLARWYRPMVVGIVVLELAWIAFVMLASLSSPSFGLDYRWHVDASQRLLDTGSPYWPWQVTGPYVIGNGAILYPPVAFALFIPFIWLPGLAWWMVPITITILAMTRHRPPLWVWPLTVGLFCLEKSLNVYVFGNPTMWLVAAVAAGTVYAWAFVFTLAKPTFAPIALLGIHHRSWWIALAILSLLSLAFGELWLDWFNVVRYSDVSLAYNLPTLALVLAPLLPWLMDPRHPVQRGRTRVAPPQRPTSSAA